MLCDYFLLLISVIKNRIMVIVRLGASNDLASIQSIVKEVVHVMNTVEGNYQWYMANG